MNLGKNVFNLLKRQEKVVIVGLGAFQKNHTPASYDEDRKVYLPPITYIGFDPSGEEGYDFVQYIQQLESLDRNSAVKLVEEAVKEITQRISEDGQVKLDDLGYLLSFGGGYVFKPLDLSGFNFEPIAGPVPTISDETLAEAVKEVPEEIHIEEEKQSDITEEEEVPTVENIVEQDKEAPVPVEAQALVFAPDNLAFDDFEEEPKRNNKIWYIVLALVAIGILAALYFVNDDKNTLDPPPLVPVVVDTTEETVDTSGGVELQLDSLVAVDSLHIATVEQDSVPPVQEKELLVPADHHWQIVIGSHKTLEQAYEQAGTYNKQGYDKVRVIPSNMAKNRKKVIWDSYKTKEEADSALIYVQKNIIKDAWPDKIK